MRKLFAGLIVLCLFSACALAADMGAPPKYIWTQNVTIAGDKTGEYPALIAQFRKAADNSKSDMYWIAASSFTGNVRDISFISFYENFASVEKDLATWPKMMAEMNQINPKFEIETGAAELQPHSTFAKYLPELSYRPEKVSAADASWWRVTVVQLKAGKKTAFEDLLKEEHELLKKVDTDLHVIGYQVIAGMPMSGGTYLLVVPMKSLSELDVDNTAQLKSVFAPPTWRQFEATASEIIEKVGVDLMMVRPDLSRPPQALVAANPEFWTIKESTAPVVAKTRKAKKVGTVEGK